MEIVDTDPSEYIASIEEADREVMRAVDRIVTKAMPNRRRVLWQGVFWGGSEQAT